MTGINDGNNNITVSTRGFFKVEAAAMHQEVRSVLVRQLFMKSRGPEGREESDRVLPVLLYVLYWFVQHQGYDFLPILL